MKKVILIIVTTIISIGSIFAQNDIPPELLKKITKQKPTSDPDEFKAFIKVIGKHTPNGVILRWAPSKPGAWKLSNAAGYTIERAEVAEGKPNYNTLTSVPIKPWPLQDWETVASKAANNKYATIAAQAIYGETFQTEGQGALAKVRELQNRWSFCLFAADVNAQAAEAAGLSYLDKTAIAGKSYSYIVKSNIDQSKYICESGSAMVTASNLVEIDKPTIDRTIALEKGVAIEWDRLYHSMEYTAYYVERATSAKGPFTRLTNDPFISTEDQVENKQYLTYTDELEENYKKYYYRIIGINAYGEESIPSDVVKGNGRDFVAPPQPANVKTEQLKDGTIKLTWQMPSTPKDMEGFYIARSKAADGQWEKLTENPLKAKANSYIDKAPHRLTHNYYMIVASDTANNFTPSLLAHTTIKDSMPPASPLNFKGEIGKNGIVKLSWDLGPEEDLGGYKIFYTNSNKNSYALLNNNIIQGNTYTDTIMVKTLTEKIYYKILAVDVYWNHGEFSDELELQRPDLIPPVVPVFSDYKVNKTGIDLEWICSTSEDVVSHTLMRKTAGSNWIKIKDFTNQTSRIKHTDANVEAGKFYRYTVIATDDAGLSSDYADPLKLTMLDKLVRVFSNISAVGEKKQGYINLTWQANQTLKRIIVYRSSNGGKFKAIHSLDGSTKSYKDDTAVKGVSYDYTLKGVLPDGSKTNFSKDVSVKM